MCDTEEIAKSESTNTKELTDKELEIIDFINEREMELEEQLHQHVRDVVYGVYGDEGIKVYNALYRDGLPIVEDEECEGCGQGIDEKISQIGQIVESVALLMSEDDHDEKILETLIEDYSGSKISSKMVKEVIEKELGEGSGTPDKILDIKKKMLFTGIMEEWLIDEYFAEDYS